MKNLGSACSQKFDLSIPESLKNQPPLSSINMTQTREPFPSWWFQPIWKIWSSKWEIFPNFRGENSKNIWVATTQATILMIKASLLSASLYVLLRSRNYETIYGYIPWMGRKTPRYSTTQKVDLSGRFFMHFAVISYAVCLTRGQQAIHIYIFFPCSSTNPSKKTSYVYIYIFLDNTKFQNLNLVGGWTTHLKNMIVKLDHSPKTDLKIKINKQSLNLWNHHLVNDQVSTGLGGFWTMSLSASEAKAVKSWSTLWFCRCNANLAKTPNRRGWGEHSMG